MTLAVLSKRSEIVSRVETRSTWIELPLAGIPDVAKVGLRAWPEPARAPIQIGVEITQVNGATLAHPISFVIALDKRQVPPPLEVVDLDDHRPAHISFGSVEWFLVAPGHQNEVRAIDAHGRAVYREVDTSIYAYRLDCSRCGRVRYARRNTLHQIQYCWVCTSQIRLHRRAGRQPPPLGRNVTRETEDLVIRLDAEGVSGKQIASVIGRSRSTVSKILKRRGRR